jgi:hypothetical protein
MESLNNHGSLHVIRLLFSQIDVLQDTAHFDSVYVVVKCIVESPHGLVLGNKRLDDFFMLA